MNPFNQGVLERFKGISMRQILHCGFECGGHGARNETGLSELTALKDTGPWSYSSKELTPLAAWVSSGKTVSSTWGHGRLTLWFHPCENLSREARASYLNLWPMKTEMNVLFKIVVKLTIFRYTYGSEALSTPTGCVTNIATQYHHPPTSTNLFISSKVKFCTH